METKLIEKLKSARHRTIKIILIVLAAAFLAQNVILTTNAYRATPLIGAKLHQRNVGGFDKKALAEVINLELEKPLTLSFEDETFEVYPREIGVKANLAETLMGLTLRGGQGIFKNIIDQDAALLGLREARIKGTVSKTLLSLKVLDIQDQANRDATPPIPDFKGDINRTLPGRAGVKVDAQALARIILANILNPPESKLPVPVRTFTSSHNESELAALRAQAVHLTSAPLIIESGGETFVLSPTDLKSMLTLAERPDPNDTKATKLALRIDDNRLNQKLGEFAARVEEKTHAEFDDHDARVGIYGQFYSGKRFTYHVPTGSSPQPPELPVPSASRTAPDEASVSVPRPRTISRRLYTANIIDTFLAQAGSQGSEATAPAPPTPSKFVHLTFDDGPNAVYHPLILDILKKYDVKATFFLVGDNARRFDAVTKRTIAEGHAIGNHSLTHAFLPHLPPEKINKEVETTTDILNTFLGASNEAKTIELLRPPYGGVNKNVKKSAVDHKLKLTLWDVDPRDWSEPQLDELVNRVLSNVKDGSDILLHSNHLATVKALPKIIEGLRTRGYEFRLLQ